MDYKEEAVALYDRSLRGDIDDAARLNYALQSIAASLVHLTAILTPKPEHPRACPLCHGTGLQETEVGRVPCRCPLGARK